MEKTIRASVIGLTKTKRELLDNDYNNYQWWMQFGIDNKLLSCFKAAKSHKQKEIKYKDYSLPLWSALIKDWFRKKDTKLTKDWIKILVSILIFDIPMFITLLIINQFSFTGIVSKLLVDVVIIVAVDKSIKKVGVNWKDGFHLERK